MDGISLVDGISFMKGYEEWYRIPYFVSYLSIQMNINGINSKGPLCKQEGWLSDL